MDNTTIDEFYYQCMEKCNKYAKKNLNFLQNYKTRLQKLICKLQNYANSQMQQLQPYIIKEVNKQYLNNQYALVITQININEANNYLLLVENLINQVYTYTSSYSNSSKEHIENITNLELFLLNMNV